MRRRLFGLGVLVFSFPLLPTAVALAGWSELTNLGASNTPHFDGHPNVTENGEWLFFNSDRPGGYGGRDIWYCRLIGWVDGRPVWGRPRNAGSPPNSQYFDGHPSLSADGQVMFFTSNRPGGLGDHDIWISTWSGGAWGLPQNLGSPVNSSTWDIEPFIASDGQTLYFASTRTGGLGGYDLYESVTDGTSWSNPDNLGPTVNTGEDDSGPWLNPSRTVLYYHSWGHDDLGQGDLFWAAWQGWRWSPAVWIGAPLSTTYAEARPSLTVDLGTIYFLSIRPEGEGDSDIYYAIAQPEEWGLAENPGAPLNSPDFDGHVTLSFDGSRVYFASDRPGGQGERDIWMSKLICWTSGGPVWSNPTNPGPPLNSPYLDSDPCLSSDGRFMYFVSKRPPTQSGDADIFVSAWIDGSGWTEPARLGSPVNSAFWDRAPFLTADGQTLFFSSIRPGGMGDYDLYRSQRVGEAWSEPVNLGLTVNTAGQDCYPWVDAGGRLLYFLSGGHGGVGGDDLFYSLWDGAAWTDPVNLGTSVNSGSGDASPDLLPNGQTLYFHSDRPGGLGDCDIYFTCSSGDGVLRSPGSAGQPVQPLPLSNVFRLRLR